MFQDCGRYNKQCNDNKESKPGQQGTKQNTVNS